MIGDKERNSERAASGGSSGLLCRLILALSLALLSCREASSAELSESEVKAAFLYNFARFIKWPEMASEPSRPFRFCIIDAPAIADALKGAMTKTLKDRPISVDILTYTSALEDCQVAYFGEKSRPPSREILQRLAEASVLVVSEEGTAGVISFIRREDRVGFIVNLDHARTSRLTLSSQLLHVAASVIGAPETKSLQIGLRSGFA